MNWISLDWDFVTGDCSVPYRANKCSAHCCNCSNTGVIGRGKVERGDADWRWLYKAMYDTLRLLTIEKCYVYDNHGEIFDYLKHGDTVWNFDAHTDDYDWFNDEHPLEPVMCWNWANHAEQIGVKVIHCYHAEYLTKLDTNESYNLFVAWSQPYTRLDLDGHLFRLLMNLGVEVKLNHGVVTCRTIE